MLCSASQERLVDDLGMWFNICPGQVGTKAFCLMNWCGLQLWCRSGCGGHERYAVYRPAVQRQNLVVAPLSQGGQLALFFDGMGASGLNASDGSWRFSPAGFSEMAAGWWLSWLEYTCMVDAHMGQSTVMRPKILLGGFKSQVQRWLES